MNVEGYHDTPFMSVHESGTFGIDLGVDVGLSSAVEPRVMSTPGAHLARKKKHGSAVKSIGAEDVDDAARSGPHFRHHRGLKTDILNISAVLEDKHAEDVDSAPQLVACEQKRSWDSTAVLQKKIVEPAHTDGAGSSGALPLRSPERLGSPRPASCGTPDGSAKHPVLQERAANQKSLLLGGGKRGRKDDVWADDPDHEDYTSPGRLQNRLMVLQERAREAIEALPVECREDVHFGMVETRVWGLEALKHVLKMRLALQSNLFLCRPVEAVPEIPPMAELLAANLTLNIHNKGNRCFANAVLRMWCWMGAHHTNPAEFWGPSTKLCMQILQQDDIPDIFWASELQPAIARLENPQNQHDASEFLIHLWELWGQTGLQGNWHAHFGGRWHEYDTIPLFIRMPVELGETVHFEQLLQEWANEGNGQCLGEDVEHIVFHVGRYSLCTQTKSWVKHGVAHTLNLQMPATNGVRAHGAVHIRPQRHHWPSRA